mmetsp:Transcript_4108/g.16475  ORF Transcript_4108/g.16475 Transcript_4108/m.16475 type:complete len:273 (-) Transcript_4108:130-948(-)
MTSPSEPCTMMPCRKIPGLSSDRTLWAPARPAAASARSTAGRALPVAMAMATPAAFAARRDAATAGRTLLCASSSVPSMSIASNLIRSAARVPTSPPRGAAIASMSPVPSQPSSAMYLCSSSAISLSSSSPSSWSMPSRWSIPCSSKMRSSQRRVWPRSAACLSAVSSEKTRSPMGTHSPGGAGMGSHGNDSTSVAAGLPRHSALSSAMPASLVRVTPSSTKPSSPNARRGRSTHSSACASALSHSSAVATASGDALGGGASSSTTALISGS